MSLTFQDCVALIEGSARDDGDALRNRALVANAIKEFAGTDEEKEQLSALFEWRHGRVLNVWARVWTRFGDTKEFASGNGDCITALAYLCQLPDAKSRELFEQIRDNIADGGTSVIPFIRALVNEHKPRRERSTRKCPKCGAVL